MPKKLFLLIFFVSLWVAQLNAANEPQEQKDSVILEKDSWVYVDCQLCDYLLVERNNLERSVDGDSNFNYHIQNMFQLPELKPYDWQDLASFCRSAQKRSFGNLEEEVRHLLLVKKQPWWSLKTSFYYLNDLARFYDFRVPMKIYKSLGIKPLIPQPASSMELDSFLIHNTPKKSKPFETYSNNIDSLELSIFLNQLCSPIQGFWYVGNSAIQDWTNQLLGINAEIEPLDLIGANHWAVYSQEDNRYLTFKKNSKLIPDSLNKYTAMWQQKEIHSQYGFTGQMNYGKDTLFSLGLFMDSFNSNYSIYQILSFSGLQILDTNYHQSGYTKFRINVTQTIPNHKKSATQVKVISNGYSDLMYYTTFTMTGYIKIY